MKNEKNWQLEVSPDEKWKELAVKGKPKWKNERNWQLEENPDEKWKELVARGKPRYIKKAGS